MPLRDQVGSRRDKLGLRWDKPGQGGLLLAPQMKGMSWPIGWKDRLIGERGPLNKVEGPRNEMRGNNLRRRLS